jgi:SAM-dependent methyltransferase
LEKHSLWDRYKLIVSGVEDSDVLRKEGITEESLDAVLCIQVLCAVKDPKTVIKEV